MENNCNIPDNNMSANQTETISTYSTNEVTVVNTVLKS